jgi:RNA polymerase sigma-70 factor (ECF subfamily)
VWRLVGESEADDVVQEVFVALFKNLAQIDPPAKLRPFVFRVARHRSYDALRRRGRYEPVTLDDEPLMEWVSLVNAEVGRPEELAHWLLIHLEVQEAMNRLPELQRQTLILYAEEGLSYAEIADIMETTIGTVKSRLHYAKKTLRQMLRPETLKSLDEELSA